MLRVWAIRALATLVLAGSLHITAGTQAPASHVLLPAGFSPWNAGVADIDGDGSHELILATLDNGRVNDLTYKTPIFIYGMSGGRLIDRSAELFETQPTSWNALIMTGDFDANGAVDLMICDRGRNVGPNPPPGNVLVDGVRGAQNEVLFNRDGKLRNTHSFPRMVTSSWGCSSGDVDRSGRATIALMSWYSGMGHDSAFLLTWDGASRFIQTRTLLADAAAAGGWGATATADFDGNGYADVSGGRQVYWNGPGPRIGAQPLEQSRIEREGFTFWRTTTTGDFTGDGLPDLVKINCSAAPVLSDARFALYQGDRDRGLVEKPDAFPATATYEGNDFAQTAIPLDVNFDGALDLVGLGEVYSQLTLGPRPATAVWLNDGSGRFRLARWSDPIQSFATCDRAAAYFLPTANPKEFHVVYGGCGLGYTARTITAAAPLAFTP